MSDALQRHFQESVEANREPGVWQPVEMINGWSSLEGHEVMFRIDVNGGIEVQGFVEGGEEGKPQIRLPEHAVPEIAEGKETYQQTRGFVGESYRRITVWRNGDMLVEILE